MCLENQLAGMAKRLTETGNACPGADHVDTENLKNIRHNMNIFHIIAPLHSATLSRECYLEITRVTMP